MSGQFDAAVQKLRAHGAEQERAAIVAWLDQWASLPPPEGDKSYHAGWSMACYNAAREIERLDHLPTKDR